MRARVNFLGHAVHPFLVVFPLGLLLTVPVFDVIHLATDHIVWAFVAFWVLTFGLIGALLAAPVGLADFLKIPRETRAWRTGVLHLGVNLAAVGLYAMSWVARLAVGVTKSGGGSFLLALIGVGVLLVGGWLGGELVQRHGMTIREDAGLDAVPSEPKRREEIPIGREPEPTL
jgi:uncharacterized membrane protein